MRRTKIVCTIGPATSSKRMLSGLVAAGMDVARLNFSHGTHEAHGAVIASLRACGRKCSRPIAILQDLSGPKIRLGELPQSGVKLARGQTVEFACCGDYVEGGPIPLPVPELFSALEHGDRLLADDGQIELRVLDAGKERLTARVVMPGSLTSRKGITSPGVALNLPAVTEKDLDDLRFGLSQGVDWVAASYIRGPEDIQPLRKAMETAGISRPIIAKIEKMEAVRRFEEILEVVDGVMVARGDLGVEIPIDEVPIVQKRLIRLCNRAGKPVITATQMLESMIHNSRPTRAEVTDVANAILDGSDAVMLSGETAAGEFPLQAVRMMAKVAARADGCLPDRELFASAGSATGSRSANDVTNAVAQAAVEIAGCIRAKAIVCATTSGGTARHVAKYRPDAAVIAATPVDETCRRLAVTWGVQPILIGDVRDTDQMLDESISAVLARKLVKPGDRLVLTAGVPVGSVGSTNLIKVHVAGQPTR